MKTILKNKNNQKIKNIYFHNNFHNGDIHLSRNFVKHYENLIDAENFYYIHNCNPKITYDLEPKIKTISGNISNLQTKLVHFEEDSIFINTWVGTENCKFLNKYLLSFNANKNMFLEVLKILNLEFPLDNEEELLPEIDYSKFNLNPLNLEFLQQNNNVMFCNNEFLSGQSYFVDMEQILQKLALKYNNYNFIVTNTTSIKQKNIFTIQDIFEKTNSDLIECSYISQYCDYIVGRSSGPYTFSITKKNLLNKEKKYFCLTKDEELVCWYEKHICHKKWFSDPRNFIDISFN